MAMEDNTKLDLPFFLRLPLEYTIDATGKALVKRDPADYSGKRGSLMLGGAAVAGAEMKYHRGRDLHYAEVLPQGLSIDAKTFAESPVLLELVFGRTAEGGDILVDEYHGYSFEIEPLYRWMSEGDAPRGDRERGYADGTPDVPDAGEDNAAGDGKPISHDANVVLSMNGMVVARGEAVLLGDRYGIRVTGGPGEDERFMLMDGGDTRGTIILGSRVMPIGALPALEPGSLVYMDTVIGEPSMARLVSGVHYQGEITHRGGWTFRVFHSKEEILRMQMQRRVRSAALSGGTAPKPVPGSEHVEIFVDQDTVAEGGDGLSPVGAVDNTVNAEREYRLNSILADLLAADETALPSPDLGNEDISIYRKIKTIVLRNATASALSVAERVMDLETYEVWLEHADDDLIFQVAGLFPWIHCLRIAGRPLYGHTSPVNLTPLSYLKNLKELALADLSLYGLSFMAGLPGIESLRVERCTGPVPGSPLDLTPLTDCGTLSRVAFALTRVDGCGEALRNKNLQEALFWKSGIAEIEFMHGMENCRRLVLGDEPITDVSVFSGLVRLEELRMAFCDRIENTSGFDALPGLPSLKFIHLECCGISDISFMEGVKRVEYLHLGGNAAIENIAPLAGCGRIYELYLQNTSVDDIGVLSQLDHLEVLNLACTPCADFSVIAGLTWLKRLDLTYTSFNDFSLLKGLDSLEELRLYWNTIGDISPIASLPALRCLHVGLCGLTAVPESITQMKNLGYLNLAGNVIPEADLADLGRSLPDCEIETGYTVTDEYHAYESATAGGENVSDGISTIDALEYEPDETPAGEPDFITWMAGERYREFLDTVAREPVPPGEIPPISRDNLAALGRLIRRVCKTVAAGLSTDAELLAGLDPGSVSLDIGKLRITRFGRARNGIAPDSALFVVQPRPLPGYAFIAMGPGCVASLAAHVSGNSLAPGNGAMDEGSITGAEDRFIMVPEYLREAWGDILPLRPRFCLAPAGDLIDGAPGDAPTVEIEIRADLGGAPGDVRVLVPLSVIAPVLPLLDADYIDGKRNMHDDMRDFFAGEDATIAADTQELTNEEKDALRAEVGPFSEPADGPGASYQPKDLSTDEIDALLAGADDLSTGTDRPAPEQNATPPSQSEIDALPDEADGMLSPADEKEPPGVPAPLSMEQIDKLLGSARDGLDTPAAEHIPLRLGDRLDEFSGRATCSGNELEECLAYAEYLVGLAIASKKEGYLGTGDMIGREMERHPRPLRTGFRMLLDGTDPDIVDRFLEMSIYANGYRGAKLLGVLFGIAFMRHVPCDSRSLVSLVDTIAELAGGEHRDRFEGMVPESDMLIARYLADNPREGPATVMAICAEIEEMILKFDSHSLGRLVTGLLDDDPDTIVDSIRYFGSRTARWTFESVDGDDRRMELVTALMEKGPTVQDCVDAQERLAAYIRGNPDFAWIVAPSKEMPL